MTMTTLIRSSDSDASPTDFDGDISIANSGGLFGLLPRSKFSSARRMKGDSGFDRASRLWRVATERCDRSGSGTASGDDIRIAPDRGETIQAGDRVGYGGEWQAPQDTNLGVSRQAMAMATRVHAHRYAGVDQRPRGARGWRISMDLTTVDLGPKRAGCGWRRRVCGARSSGRKDRGNRRTASYQLVTGVIHREAPVISKTIVET